MRTGTRALLHAACLSAIIAAATIPAEAQEAGPSETIATWCWGLGLLEFNVAHPVGSDVNAPDGSTKRFKTSYGFTLSLPFEFADKIQVAPELRILFPGMNAGYYDMDLLDDESGVLVAPGVALRYMPVRWGDVRPIVGLHYTHIDAGVTTSISTCESTSAGSNWCTEGAEHYTIVSYEGSSIAPTLGIRYDMLWYAPALSAEADMVSLLFEASYAFNSWGDKNTDVESNSGAKPIGGATIEEITDDNADIDVNHIWFAVSLQFLF